MNMTRLFGILSISTLALVALTLTADSARSQDDQGGGSFWGGGFGGGGRGGGRQRMQMQQMGGEGDDGSGYGGFGGGFGGRGGGRVRGGIGRGGRGGGFQGGGYGMDGGFDGGMDVGGPGGQTSRGQGGGADSGAGGTKPSTANDGIPHFSDVVGMSPPPGFGGALAVSTTVTTIGSSGSSSGGASASAATSSSGTSSPAQVDEKTRSFAQAKMKQFDKNNNNQLEKEEWSQMNDGEKYDANKDGVVSLDEMIQYLSRPLGSDDSVDTSKPKSPSKPTSTGGRPGRFRSLAERYPDLSAKFFQLDRDGDGQIEMWEFSTNWTEQTVREFQKYDLNGDGIITPEEWLKVEPKGR